MSNRFVSGGTMGAGGEEICKDMDAAPQARQQQQQQQPLLPLAKNAQWEAAQRELEAERKRREEARLKASMGEEKSLYEILQANKG